MNGPVLPRGSLLALGDINYDEFIQLLEDDITVEGHEKTLKFLSKYGLIYNKLNCPDCKDKHEPASMVRYVQSPDGFTWRCNKCRYATDSQQSARFSVRRDSFFWHTHLSIRTILKLIYYWTTFSKATIAAIKNECRIEHDQTVIDYFNFLRDVAQGWALRIAGQERLGGYGTIVECDESKFYRVSVCLFLESILVQLPQSRLAKYHRGKQLERERNSGK